ncbi:MAG: hypothetical protein IKR58_01965 [Lachnospiraceae bacterium]|nr:hypothetical protein [Lachnospiraceae bacterium]
MPRTKYDNVQNVNEQYEKVFKNVDKKQKEEWGKGFKETSRLVDQKKTAMLDFIGSDLSDEDFARFEDKVKNDQKAINLFNRMAGELTAIQVIKHKKDFLNALAGDILNIPEEEWESNYKFANETCTKYTAEREYKNSKISEAVKKVTDREKRNSAQYTMALADGAYDEKTGSDPVQSDPQRKEDYVKMAAKLVSYAIVEQDTIMPTGSNSQYDYNKVVNALNHRKELQKGVENDLAGNKDFAAFVMQQRAAGKPAADFKKENLFASWNQYKENLQAARDEYLGFMETNKNTIKEEADINKKPGYLLFSAELIDTDVRKEEVQTECDKILKDPSLGKAHLSMDQFVKGANLIVADMLKSPAADKTFYDDDRVKSGSVMDSRKVNKAFINMRDQVINDPIFRDVMATRPSGKNLVDSYKTAVNKEVNKKINAEKAEKARRKDNFSLDSSMKKFAQDNTIEISADEYEKIKETREALKKMNEGKKPSDHMKRLTDALDAVISQGEKGAQPKVGALEELNSAALNYYNKRQGILFSPLTDNGKARFATVEKLVFATDKIHGRCEEAFDNAINPNKNANMQKNTAVKK